MLVRMSEDKPKIVKVLGVDIEFKYECPKSQAHWRSKESHDINCGVCHGE